MMPATTIAEAFEQARSMDAPLSERLSAYAQATRHLNAPFADAVDRLVGRLRAGQVAEGSPKEGEPMPSFLLPDHTGRLVSLEDLVADGPVAVTFARGHWCPYCRIAVSALGEIADDAAALGAQIIVIVPDRQSFAARLRAETAAPFPILTDVENGYALSLGLVFWVGDEMQKMMLARNANPAQSQGNDSWFLPVPATFIVGRDGIIKARHVDPDYRTRMEIDSVLEALRQAAQG
jgi:peroxiredoxin